MTTITIRYRVLHEEYTVEVKENPSATYFIPVLADAIDTAFAQSKFCGGALIILHKSIRMGLAMPFIDRLARHNQEVQRHDS